MAAGVIRLGATAMAAGLFWQAAPSPAAALREARILAGKDHLDCDLLCLRRHGLPQFGLGRKNAGHRAGMPAVAVALANAVDLGSWLGLFGINRQWLLVMVRKGAILPDGDAVFDDEDVARRAFDAAIDGNGWDGIFAPSVWAVAGASTLGLGEILKAPVRDGRLRDGRLRDVAGRRLWPALAACLAMGGGAALWWFLQPPAPEIASQDIPRPPPPPWRGTPSPLTVVLACQRAIEATVTLPGFDIDGVSCDGLESKVSYRRRSGTLAWLPESAVAVSPDLVTMSRPLSLTGEGRRGDEPPWPVNRLRRHLWGASQSFGLSSDISQPAAEKSTLAGRESQPDPLFRSVRVSLGSPLPAAVLARILDAVPALVVEEVNWRPSQWTVKGRAYVR
ncbi:MAG TPA: type 4b pilus protein PilO2 [Rhodospirillaceae bacterium]|nr:type 4b pilus protein PilO2 [Rhodospirillaceae bacterium]